MKLMQLQNNAILSWAGAHLQSIAHFLIVFQMILVSFFDFSHISRLGKNVMKLWVKVILRSVPSISFENSNQGTLAIHLAKQGHIFLLLHPKVMEGSFKFWQIREKVRNQGNTENHFSYHPSYALRMSWISSFYLILLPLG